MDGHDLSLIIWERLHDSGMHLEPCTIKRVVFILIKAANNFTSPPLEALPL